VNTQSSETILTVKETTLYKKLESRLGALSVFLAYPITSAAMMVQKHRDPDIANLSYIVLWIALCRRSLRKDTEKQITDVQSRSASFFSGRKKVILLCGAISIPSILTARNTAEQIGRCLFFLVAGLIFSLDVPSRVKSYFKKTGSLKPSSDISWIIYIGMISGFIALGILRSS